MSAAITFQVARDFEQLALQPGDLLRPEEIGVGPVAVLLLAVGAAIAAHVEHEDVEQRAVGDLAIDPARLSTGSAHRHVFVEGAARARGERSSVVDVFLAQMLGAGQRLAGPPVVGDLVVVPLREDRHLAR